MRSYLPDRCTSHAGTSSRCQHALNQTSTRTRWRYTDTKQTIKGFASATDAVPKDPFEKKEVYHDNVVDKLFVSIFSKKMAKQLGPAAEGTSYASGYEGFVDLSRELMKGRNSQQQREVILNILGSLLPPEASARFRKWFPLSQWSAETNAKITTIFFKWLVGPMEIEEKELDLNGELQKWKSGVKIKKCRYLEQSGCVGLCYNLCKRPTEEFFGKEFGLPLTMNPNLEDLSCEMIFGQAPPPITEDPCYNAPCFPHVCKIGERDASKPCPKIDTERWRKKQVP